MKAAYGMLFAARRFPTVNEASAAYLALGTTVLDHNNREPEERRLYLSAACATDADSVAGLVIVYAEERYAGHVEQGLELLGGEELPDDAIGDDDLAGLMSRREATRGASFAGTAHPPAKLRRDGSLAPW